jgi:hypothetical protein
MLPTSPVTKIVFIEANILCKLYQLESERADELLALSLEMTELNGSGGSGGCYV